MNSTDPDLIGAIQDFKKGGWVIALLGALGMFARLILTEEKYSFFVWLRKIIAGGIVGVLAYFALYGTDIAPIYKSVIYSISGSLAPEIWEFVRRKFKKETK
jgi:hypothetical protein